MIRKKPVTVRLPWKIYEFCREMAEEEGQPVASFISQLVCDRVRGLGAIMANCKSSVMMEEMLKESKKMRAFMEGFTAEAMFSTVEEDPDRGEVLDEVLGEEGSGSNAVD